MDGLYSSAEMLDFLQKYNFYYVMRFASNRILDTNSGRCKISLHPGLIHYRNERCKVIQAKYKGIQNYFISQKRVTKSQKIERIFLVSNMDLFSKQYIEVYNGRWAIEKLFRTLKQSFGLGDCQSTRGKKQEAHIKGTFFAYAIFSIEKIDNHANSVE